ncbi:MAG: UvrD-helicase domain-containing protein [Bacteroidaceae bacterium]|nr:UvrD-helicase domain-containing protein [Bacteroidaceae bacterium]
MTDATRINDAKGELTVYKASAGSGKTFTLTAEYIARLLEKEASGHRNILAVTFTNKATAEMKERILQELWELAYGQRNKEDGPSDFMRAVMSHLPATDADTLRQRAAAALHDILHEYDYFRVETIDSFFQSLLSNMAHELGMSAGFKVDINDRDVIDKAVDRLMLGLASKPDVLSWVLDYIRERIDDNKRWDVTKEVKQLAGQLMKEVFLLHDEELAEMLDSGEKLGAYRRKLRQLTKEAKDVMVQAAERLHEEIVSDAEGYGAFNRGGSLEKYLKDIAEDKPGPPNKTVQKYLDDAENWLRAKEKNLPGRLPRAERLREYLISVENLRDRGTMVINSSELSLRHINPLRLLNEISREIADINHENNRFMMAKTPLLFQRLVGKDDASFVFEKAGIELQHVMIDEFQDTSTLQWANFKNLFVENMAHGNGCLLVGDVKQGIYRFRNGDWNILAGIGNEFKNRKIVIHGLDTNFRSAENIVDFNNLFFPRAATVLDSLAENSNIAQLYDDVRQNNCGKPGGHVRVCLFPKNAKETTDNAGDGDGPLTILDDLAEQIVTLHKAGTGYDDMAILVRNKNIAGEILDYFSENHPEVPLISDEAFLLSASPAVQLMIHALRYLKDETDGIARTYVSEAYNNRIAGKGLDWTETIREAGRLLPRAFADNRKELLSLPLYELCERLSALFGLENCKEDTPYLYAFFDQVLAFLDDHPSDIGIFLEHWDESLYKKPIPAGEVSGIRILTIHKSKGLAFHTVLLPFCDWDLERDRQEDLLWCEPGQAPYNELPVVPVPLYSSASVRHSIYAGAYEKEHLQRRIENLNLMYVAFTRAKENLYIWAGTREKITAIPTMGDIIYECLKEDVHEDNGIYIYEQDANLPKRKQTAENKDKTGENATHNPLKTKPENLYVPMESFEARVRFRQSNEAAVFVAEDNDEHGQQQTEYLERGKLLHYLLSNIETSADIDKGIGELRASGIIGTDTDPEQLARFIGKRLERPVIADWFDGSWKLYNECTILTHDEKGHAQTRRPDRVMVRDGQTVVVDFKFGNPKPEHADQVRTYLDLLRRMGHSNVSGYLWYVYSNRLQNVAPHPDINPTDQ